MIFEKSFLLDICQSTSIFILVSFVILVQIITLSWVGSPLATPCLNDTFSLLSCDKSLVLNTDVSPKSLIKDLLFIRRNISFN